LNIQPASLDITIGNTFSFPDETVSDGIIRMDVPLKYKIVEQDSYLLMPGQFVLATTEQYFKIPDDLAAFVEGRSSIGRLGLFIQNAGWIDPGFEGQITLELFNASRYAIEIKSGFRVGQLVFSPTDTPVENAYRGKYQGQIGATGSMIYKDYVDDSCSDAESMECCSSCIRNHNGFCDLLTIPINMKNDYCKHFVRK
jgi:dCTP deaminase